MNDYERECKKYISIYRVQRLKNPRRWKYYSYLIRQEKLNIKISRIEDRIDTKGEHIETSCFN